MILDAKIAFLQLQSRFCARFGLSAVMDCGARYSGYTVEIDPEGELHGPTAGDLLSCTLGELCAADIAGFGMETTNKVVVISEGACGDASMVVATDTYTDRFGRMEGGRNGVALS